MRCALLLVTLAACNQVFGLDPTEPAPDTVVDDGDHDGIDEASDNCPTVANPDQADSDDDGIGDACDGCDHCLACAVGPAHDEDGDRIADGCDDCPAAANADQLDGDGDGLGDACDLDPATQQHRLVFAGFDTLDGWVPPAGWKLAGDAAVPDPPASQTDKSRLTRFGIGLVQGTPWSFEVGLVLPPAPADGTSVGVRPVSDTGVGSLVSCSLLAIGGAWQLSAGGPSVPTATPTPLVLRASGLGTSGVETSTCTIAGGATTSATQTALAYPLFPQLFTDPGSAIRYVDVVQ